MTQAFGEMQSTFVWQGKAHFPYCVLQWCVPQGTSFVHVKATGPGTAIAPPAGAAVGAAVGIAVAVGAA